MDLIWIQGRIKWFSGKSMVTVYYNNNDNDLLLLLLLFLLLLVLLLQYLAMQPLASQNFSSM